MEDKIKRDIEFLFEVGAMRNIERSWKHQIGADFQNLNEHIIRVIWISFVLSKYEGGDINKIIKMALIHDLPESRTGDVDQLKKQFVKREEGSALNDIIEGTSLEDIKTLWEEAEEKKTKEARIVKDADYLDQQLELQEQYVKGIKIREDWKFVTDKMRDGLFTETAKKFWREIENSNPHDWHLNARKDLK